jgi:aryl-alcohol dehydrogenase-like predicted oxidoreductase
MQRAELSPGYSISRVIKGSWHLAGGHGLVDRRRAIDDMARFVEAGITTFDCADIYTGVESLIGEFRAAYPELAAALQVHTKFVPDLGVLGTLGAKDVEAGIDRSLARLGVEHLDLVQFHWWDYAVPRYVEIGLELARLRQAGKIARIGVTNFGTRELTALLDAGVPVVSHQLQYSLLDQRPTGPMSTLCRDREIAFLCYGTVAGGFLSERWLGVPEPDAPLENRSLTKYKLIIDDAGGWAWLQSLLDTLDAIARRHDADIATVATRAVLDRPLVAAAIVGATGTSHLQRNARIDALVLDEGDQAALAAVIARGHVLAGDVYELERDRNGRHGSIMKYNLGRGADAVAGSGGA